MEVKLLSVIGEMQMKGKLGWQLQRLCETMAFQFSSTDVVFV